MKALIGRKLGMTQIFDEQGQAKAVTLVETGPCVVTALKTEDRDGYAAVQLGFDEEHKANKPKTGHTKSSKKNPRYLREFKGEHELKVGDRLDVTIFQPGEKIVVSGTSKGKGFAGTIKRHNFSRGPETHGSRNQRRPGSIGSMYPQKIYKGRKMPGRMGNDKVTVKNLPLGAVDSDNNLLAIQGAVPGRRGSIVTIKGEE